MKTRITELLGCECPIIQGGMAWVAEHKLASAVSNAGGVGLIAGGNAPIDYLREQIHLCKEKTDKPFGVNIMLMSDNADDLAQLVIDEKISYPFLEFTKTADKPLLSSNEGFIFSIPQKSATVKSLV